MRELEFLPSWYPEMYRRRRWVGLQTWLALIVAVGLGTWLVLAERNCRAAAAEVAALRGQATELRPDTREMAELEALESELKRQEQVQSKLGLHVEAARLIGTLTQLMPADMSLLHLGFETDETPQAMGAMARGALKDPQNVPIERRLRIRLTGVAPTDVDIANFITEVNKVPFFERVLMVYAKDRRQQGYVMREFELMCSIPLDSIGGGQ